MVPENQRCDREVPGVVLGSKAARWLLGVVQPGRWLGGRSFTVLGIARSPRHWPKDSSNSALIGVSAASTYFDARADSDDDLYERSSEDQVENVQDPCSNKPWHPKGSTGLKVSRPSDV